MCESQEKLGNIQSPDLWKSYEYVTSLAQVNFLRKAQEMHLTVTVAEKLSGESGTRTNDPQTHGPAALPTELLPLLTT